MDYNASDTLGRALQLQQEISRLISEHGVSAVLEAISNDISKREKIIRDNNDRNLGGAVEYMFPALIKAYPKVGKKLGNWLSHVLKCRPVVESLKIIKADSPNQSVAMKEAYNEWERMNGGDEYASSSERVPQTVRFPNCINK
jgi:hypothetical protein